MARILVDSRFLLQLAAESRLLVALAHLKALFAKADAMRPGEMMSVAAYVKFVVDLWISFGPSRAGSRGARGRSREQQSPT